MVDLTVSGTVSSEESPADVAKCAQVIPNRSQYGLQGRPILWRLSCFADNCFEQIFCTRPLPKWLLNALDSRFNRNRRGQSGIAVNIACDWNSRTKAELAYVCCISPQPIGLLRPERPATSPVHRQYLRILMIAGCIVSSRPPDHVSSSSDSPWIPFGLQRQSCGVPLIPFANTECEKGCVFIHNRLAAP